MQDLDGVALGEPNVPRLVHAAHPSFPQNSHNLIALPEPSADQWIAPHRGRIHQVHTIKGTLDVLVPLELTAACGADLHSKHLSCGRLPPRGAHRGRPRHYNGRLPRTPPREMEWALLQGEGSATQGPRLSATAFPLPPPFGLVSLVSMISTAEHPPQNCQTQEPHREGAEHGSHG